MMELRPAEPGDVNAIAALLAEMDLFYGTTEPSSIDVRVPEIRDAIWGAQPAAYLLLAWEDARLVGLAAYSFLWPAAGVSRSLYLKELYVSEDSRAQGVGRLLMSEVCKIAAHRECSRVEWTTDIDNEEAQRFYAALGVPLYTGKLFYRLDQGALQGMADFPSGVTVGRPPGTVG